MADECNLATVVSTERDVTPLKRRRNGYCCAVAECKSKHGNGLSLHRFPTDTKTRRQWIKFVQTCRADFGTSFGTPNQNSKICSLHFTSDCYPAKIALAASFGLKTQTLLNPKSVPTVQKPHRLAPIVTCSSTLSTVSSVSTASRTVTHVTMAVTAPICMPAVAPKQSVRIRGAFAKRERQRVIADLLLNNTSGSDQDDHDTAELLEKPSLTADASVQTEVSLIVETVLPEQMDKQKKCSRGVQVYPETRHKDVELVYSDKIAEQDHVRKTRVQIEIDNAEEPPFLHMQQQQHLQALTREGANTEHTAIIQTSEIHTVPGSHFDVQVKQEVCTEDAASSQDGQTSETHTVPGSHSDIQVKQEVCIEDAASSQMRKTEKQALYSGNSDVWMKQEASMDDEANTWKGQTFKTHAVSGSHSDIQIKQEVSMDDESIIQKGQMFRTHTVYGSKSDIQIKQEVNTENTNT